MTFRRLVNESFKVKQRHDSQEAEIQRCEAIYTSEPEDNRHKHMDMQNSPVEFIREDESFSKSKHVYITTYSTLAANSHPDPCGHPSGKEQLPDDGYKLRCPDCGEESDMLIEGGSYQKG